MNQQPSISACVPCYNGAATLERAVESIRNQSKRIDELIIVDDGSTDGSAEIAARVGDRVVRLPRNCGRGTARALAIEEARGEFVLFCDAGLSIERDFTRKALSYLEKPKVAGVFGLVSDPEARTWTDRWRARHLFRSGPERKLNRKASLATGAVLMRREAALKVGNFDATLSGGEDQELGQRLLKAGWEVVCDPALQVRPLLQEGVSALLRRYVRWNCAPGHIPSWREYARFIAFHGDRARADVRAGDFRCAVLTMFAPHYIFWSRRMGIKGRKHTEGSATNVTRCEHA